jgi:hypothetical protein
MTKQTKPFKWEKGEIHLCEEKGHELAMSYEPYGFVKLRTSKGISYHGTYESMFKEIRHTYLYKTNPESLHEVLVAEQKAFLLIAELGNELKKKGNKSK